MTGPLKGLRVLDLSRVLAGPWATQMLADLGAEVVKVERPQTGDDTRHWGPPFSAQGDSAYYLCANRGKKSVEIDLASREGQTWVKNRLAKTDVLVENFRVGGLAKYGLDYTSLCDEYPGLVYCSITGFGQTGPQRNRPGYDFLIQAMGGLMSVTGEKDDGAGAEPQRAGVAVADLMTGMYATIAILAALAHRDKTGRGQCIDLALLDCQIAMMANQATNYLVSGTAPGRIGNAHPNIVPYQLFHTRGGHIIVAVGNNRQFERFCKLIQREDLATDSRFVTNAERVRNREALVSELSPILADKTTDEWVALFESVNVPCGPVNNLAQVFQNPQVIERGMLLNMTTDSGEAVELVANPIRFSESPISYTCSPPTLGNANKEFKT